MEQDPGFVPTNSLKYNPSEKEVTLAIKGSEESFGKLETSNILKGKIL